MRWGLLLPIAALIAWSGYLAIPRGGDPLATGAIIRICGPVLAALAFLLWLALPMLRRRDRRCARLGGSDRLGDICALVSIAVLCLGTVGCCAAVTALNANRLDVEGTP